MDLAANSSNQLEDPLEPNYYAYDAPGNMTAIAGVSGTLTYDAEGRLTTVAGVTYTGVYPERSRRDGDGFAPLGLTINGRRVKKSSGWLYWYPSAPLGTGGPWGEVLWESNLTGGTLRNEYFYFNGQRVARRDGAGTVFYYFSDHLGTARKLTDASGNACYDADYYPFGGERVYTTTCSQNYKFTGQERDGETSEDHFWFRQYASSVGRWTSPDPLGGLLGDPQTLNLYAYVRNAPVNYVDPLGLQEEGIAIEDYLLINDMLCSGWTHWPRSGAGAGGDGSGSAPGTGDTAAEPPPPEPTDKQGNPCFQKILGRVNARFGTNFTENNLQRDPQTNLLAPLINGTANITISVTSALTPQQFNAIGEGRFGGGVLGAGSTLHVPEAPKQNTGGVLSATIRAHLDAGNPTRFPFLFGGLSHLFGDVATNDAGPCP